MEAEIEKINKWDRKVFSSRSDKYTKRGHVPGSPDDWDISIYKNALKGAPSGSRSLVMGMTIGIREVLHSLDYDVTCLEISNDAIDFLSDGITKECQYKERIVQGDWLNMSSAVSRRFDFIVGDGVFPNILDFDKQELLARQIHDSLEIGGKFITRACLITSELDLENRKADRLIDRFRARAINSAEFGHSMRIWGCYDSAYDRSSYLLDNRAVYETYEKMLSEGRLTEEEYDLVNRQYFGGHHFYPPEEYWQKLLADAGFAYKRHINNKFIYHDYLPIYECVKL